MQPGGHNTVLERALGRSSSDVGNAFVAQELDERLRDERLTRFVQVRLVGKIYVFAGLEASFENGGHIDAGNPFGVTETPHQVVLSEPVAVQDLEIDRPFVDVEVIRRTPLAVAPW